MFKRIEQVEKRYQELEQQLTQEETLQDKNLYTKYAKEYASLGNLVDKYRKYKALLEEIAKVESILKGRGKPQEREFLELAQAELLELSQKKQNLELELEELLLDEPGRALKNVIVEIRAGTGGEEAALFVADLYRMYTKFALRQGWRAELMSSRPTDIGGFKEIVFSLQGQDVFQKMNYESGVHRVQRVPVTEGSGRIHTSAVSVAVLPEPEDLEVKIDPKDIRVDVFRSTGPGGQGVNTTDSAVRITHLPTGIVVSCQDERSQLKNKVKALRVLRARILDKMQSEQENKIKQQRKTQVGTGDRSEKIRTYNFPDRRITDHRIGFTLHKLEAVLAGELEEIVAALLKEDKKKRLEQWKRE
ncbi:MAG: peptide chain release factor 1 [Candidatus Omnitrophica bacterium]|nr:peptide chain release factor 1 [Candidatus Omnitrophota bacterium]